MFLYLLDVLDKLVHVEKFFAEHPQFRDSAAALKTCGQLRKRSLAMAKSQVTDALNLAVRSALGQPTDKLESSSVYIRFSGVAEKVNKIVLLMHRYANDDDAVLEECRQLYCGQRLALLRQVVTSFFAVRLRGCPREATSLSLSSRRSLSRVWGCGARRTCRLRKA